MYGRVEGANHVGIASINPATGKVAQRFDLLDAIAVEDRIRRSHQAFLSYRPVRRQRLDQRRQRSRTRHQRN
ncbi:MAG: hypothetical protein ACFCBU_00625 [Cyanophyceae cyanobacterium]